MAVLQAMGSVLFSAGIAALVVANFKCGLFREHLNHPTPLGAGLGEVRQFDCRRPDS